MNLDDAAVRGEHEVGIGLGVRILGVVQVAHGDALEQPARDGCDLVGQRHSGHQFVLDEVYEGEA